MRLDFHKISIVSLTLTLILMFSVLVLLLKPYNINEIEEPAKILTPVVEAGDDVVFNIKFCKKRDIQASITRLLVKVEDPTSVRIPLIEFTDNAPAKCNDFDVHEKIPEFVESGKYIVYTSIVYRPNFIRGDVEYNFETEPFSIIGK